MNWKITILHSSIIFAAVLISVRLFVPAGAWQYEKIDEILSERMQLLSDQIRRMERQANSLAGQRSGSTLTAAQTSGMDEIVQSLRAVRESLARLENNSRYPRPVVESPPAFMAPVAQTPVGTSPAAKGPTAWIGELSEDKRARVEDIFNQHAESLRAKFPRDGSPPDPETMRLIVEESEQELRGNLKSALNEKEYRKFLNSLPGSPNAGSLPGPVVRGD